MTRLAVCSSCLRSLCTVCVSTVGHRPFVLPKYIQIHSHAKTTISNNAPFVPFVQVNGERMHFCDNQYDGCKVCRLV